MPRPLRQAEARRLAISAQGLAAPRPATPTPAAINRAIARTGVLQLDTVNVFERSHYLPLLARLGPYPRPPATRSSTTTPAPSRASAATPSTWLTRPPSSRSRTGRCGTGIAPPRSPDARLAIEQLVADGVLEPVSVDSWAKEAWMPAGQRIPRKVETAALLSPFDPLVWFRPRAERLFDFHYRISNYTPREQREHGYYVLPVLIDDQIAARVDLKSDRRAGVLRVQHTHIEPAHQMRIDEVASRVAPS